MGRNAMDETANTARPIHHVRFVIPMSANGASVGFKSTKGPKNGHRVARATHITSQRNGLPWTAWRPVVGNHTQIAIAAHAMADGRQYQTIHAVTATGTAYQSQSGSTVVGANTRTDGGG